MTEQETYEEFSKLQTNELKELIGYYYEQVDLVKDDEQQIKVLRSQPQNKKNTQKLEQLMQQYNRDKIDLIQIDSDARIAENILAERKGDAPVQQRRVTKSTPVTKHDALLVEQTKKRVVKTYRDPKYRIRIGYLVSLSKLREKLKPDDFQTAVDSINFAKDKNEMIDIYKFYKARAKGEQVPERLLPKPTMTQTTTIDPMIIDKQPKYVSKGATSQTSQTQTLVPLNAFKFIEKGENRFLEPITPEKADDLAMKKKTIESVIMLNPNRFRRKPHVVYSRHR